MLDEESIFYIKELAEIPERLMLLNRVIPFRQVDEVRVPASSMLFIAEDDLSAILFDKLQDKVPEGACFVDTPSLPTSPITEKEVCLIDSSTDPPSISSRFVRKTSWGEVPHAVWTLRAYLHEDYDRLKEEVRKVFRTIVEKEAMTETHY